MELLDEIKNEIAVRPNDLEFRELIEDRDEGREITHALRNAIVRGLPPMVYILSHPASQHNSDDEEDASNEST